MINNLNSTEVLELDSDIELNNNITTDGLYPYDPSKGIIDLAEDPMSVFQYVRKYNQGSLKIDPEFQRNLVWKKEQKSKFIESLILNFPIPPFYVNETIDRTFIIIDGLQRTTTIIEFLENKFELAGLSVYKNLNTKKFKDLEPSIQARIEDKKINFYILKPSTPIYFIYDLFYRINTGGTQLNKQEIRNCIYMGKSTELLKELANEEYFKQAIGLGISGTRMLDREAVLRVLSFIYKGHELYENEMSAFLEDMMKKINKMKETEIDLLKNKFKRVMTLTFDFFGNQNFRFPTEQTRGVINLSIMDSVCVFFNRTSDEFLKQNKTIIKRNFKELIKDQKYFENSRYSTATRSSVLNRIKIADEILLQNTDTTNLIPLTLLMSS